MSSQPEDYAETTPVLNPLLPPSPDVVAKWFSDFEVLELIGHGGMGAVYKARDRNLDRIVAIKIIHHKGNLQSGFAERFIREAKALARLSHPNIISVYRFGKVETNNQDDSPATEVYFLATEYVPGLNLRQWMAHNDVQQSQTLAIISQVCDALQYSHNQGVVHRDIKPENILLEKIGEEVRVKVVDFGLAKIPDSLADPTLTGVNEVMGTFRYMAPEQLERSGTVDHRADLYSLGVVFYEMLTGKTPMGNFQLPSKSKAMDSRIDSVVMRSLAREPEQRFQQAHEIKTQLFEISKKVSDPTARSKWPDFGYAVYPMIASVVFYVTLTLLFSATRSTWSLLALAIPMIGLPFWFSWQLHKISIRSITTLAVGNVLATCLFIGFVVAFANKSKSSHEALLQILALCGAALCGVGAGVGGNLLRQLSFLSESELLVRAQKKLEASTLENLQVMAFIIGIVGVFRSCFLISEFWTASETVGWKLVLLGLTGPIVLVGAIAMSHAIFFPLVLIACVLCMLSGNPISFIVGVCGLWSLFSVNSRLLFRKNSRFF